MSSPGAGFIEGLLNGGEAGYGLRDRINTGKRRDQLQADLLTLRRQSEGDRHALATRQQTTFDEQQAAYQRVQALRAEVARHLAAGNGPTPDIAGATSMREVSRSSPGLSPDATMAQEIGRTLARAGDVPLSDDQSLLLGSGAIPTASFERLARARHTGRSTAAAKPPITEDRALAAIDNVFGIWEGGQRVGHRLTPAQRYTLARKMVDGTATAADFPDIPDEARKPEQPHADEQPSGGGPLDRLKNWLFGGGQGGSAAPTKEGAPPARGAPVFQPPSGPAAGDPGDGGRDMESARAAIEQYRDLPHEEIEAVLSDEGYTDEEIRQLLGSTP